MLLLILTSPVWLPSLIFLLWYDRTRAFLGYSFLFFGALSMAFYGAHSIGIY